MNAPAGYTKELSPLPKAVLLTERIQGSFDRIQIFVKDKADLDRASPRAVRALEPISTLWISSPKGTSGIQTDLTRDSGWETPRIKRL